MIQMYLADKCSDTVLPSSDESVENLSSEL